MKQLITALILATSAITAQAEEKTDIKMPFNECTTQARELAKKGVNVKEINMLRSSGLMMWFFETNTHYITVSCMLIGQGYDQMSVTKETLAQARAKNDKAEANRKAKTQDLSKQLGL
jgi:cell division protein FtsB